MTMTALIVAAGKGERLGGGVPKQYRAARRQAGAALGGRGADRVIPRVRSRSRGRDRRRAARRRPQRRSAGCDVGPIHRAAPSGGFGARRARSDRWRCGADPRCRPPLLPARRRSTACSPRSNSTTARRRCLPVGDTLARAGDSLDEPVDRTGLVRVQTPQAFRLDALRNAYDRWTGGVADRRDDGRFAPPGMQVATVEGDPALDKLTSAADFDARRAVARRRA